VDLSRKMNHHINALHDLIQMGSISDISFDQLEFGITDKGSDVVDVPIAEIVEPYHGIAIVDVLFNKMATNEASSTCY